MSGYEQTSAQYNPEWDARMAKLLARGLTPRAANVVLAAAMFGIGCTEGTVRAQVEAQKENQ